MKPYFPAILPNILQIRDGVPGFVMGTVAFVYGPQYIRFCKTVISYVGAMEMIQEEDGSHCGLVVRKEGPEFFERFHGTALWGAEFNDLADVADAASERNKRTSEFTLIGAPVCGTEAFMRLKAICDYVFITYPSDEIVVTIEISKTPGSLNRFVTDLLLLR